jgi:hypothetical protein
VAHLDGDAVAGEEDGDGAVDRHGQGEDQEPAPDNTQEVFNYSTTRAIQSAIAIKGNTRIFRLFFFIGFSKACLYFFVNQGFCGSGKLACFSL